VKSPLPDSNRRPLPYHGSALPTELRGQKTLQISTFAKTNRRAFIRPYCEPYCAGRTLPSANGPTACDERCRSLDRMLRPKLRAFPRAVTPSTGGRGQRSRGVLVDADQFRADHFPSRYGIATAARRADRGVVHPCADAPKARPSTLPVAVDGRIRTLSRTSGPKRFSRSPGRSSGEADVPLVASPRVRWQAYPEVLSHSRLNLARRAQRPPRPRRAGRVGRGRPPGRASWSEARLG
jgi:hypothetical protein